jgi:hypothetical protein
MTLTRGLAIAASSFLPGLCSISPYPLDLPWWSCLKQQSSLDLGTPSPRHALFLSMARTILWLAVYFLCRLHWNVSSVALEKLAEWSISVFVTLRLMLGTECLINILVNEWWWHNLQVCGPFFPIFQSRFVSTFRAIRGGMSDGYARSARKQQRQGSFLL